MKNIFKSLMFVAVAAMTFTACEKDNAETNSTEQKTVITFNAEIEGTNTRSYFGAYDETNGYPTLLSGNEVAKFNHWTTSTGNLAFTEATINGENRFTVSFGETNPEGNTVDAYMPASAWGDVKNTWYDNYSYCEASREYTIPLEQNPTTTSVDEKAHIFKATIENYNGTNNTLVFKHQVAYGKLSLKNFAGTNVTQYAITINGKMYVVNASWTTDVWFACEPCMVTDMSISVVAAEGTYTKTIVENSDKTLAFVKGQVSKFGVDMSTVTTGEAVDAFAPDVTMTYNSWSDPYFNFKADGYSGIRLYLHGDDRPGNNSIKIGTYTCTGTNATPSSSGQFGFRISDGFSIGYSAGELNVSYDSTKEEYTITFNYNGQVFGYRGMPNGWVAPTGSVGGGDTGGNDGGDSNVVTVTGVASSGNMGKNYTFNCTPQLTISFAMTNYMSTGTYELRVGYSGESNVCNVMDIGGNTPTSVSGSISYTWSSPNAVITFNDVVIDGITFKGENITYSLM